MTSLSGVTTDAHTARGVQTIDSAQTEIIIYIQSFFGLSKYESNRTFKNINRINRNFI
jgi:hypothetical protein